MREIDINDFRKVSGGRDNGGYWENHKWDNKQHSDWANQWHQAGQNAWDNRVPGRGYPGQGHEY